MAAENYNQEMADFPSGHAGFIRAYGMYWDRSEVNWSPGQGNKGGFRLLGRDGKQYPKLKVCDFRPQRGIYILYDDHGPVYVGLAKQQDLGNRLRDHTYLTDALSARWSRFSWFGWCRVLVSSGDDGAKLLGKVPQKVLTNSDSTIRDIEALLIESLGTHRTSNIQKMKFASALKWEQVKLDETQKYLNRLWI